VEESGKSDLQLEDLTRRLEAAITTVVPQATRVFIEYGRDL
jgi:hypothetical protein